MSEIVSDHSAAAWREAVGGMWDEIGQLQFNFLVSQGLEPHHALLDVGCGCLRGGGVHFIRFLEDGHYHGIDALQWLLDAGVREELSRHGLSGRSFHLLCREDFDCTSFGVAFDYAIAQSVLTHLTWNGIFRCLQSVGRVLKPEGRLSVCQS